MTNQQIKFTKMHGLGNDFVVIDAISQKISIDTFPVRQLANRHSGIGFDQILFLLPSDKKEFGCRIFNSDGSEAEQCGNGLRSLARFIWENKLSSKNQIELELKNRQVTVEGDNFTSIKVNMGTPSIAMETSIIPETQELPLTILSLGNPHAITIVSSLAIPLEKWGETISTHKQFPQGINVGFMQIKAPNRIELRTFERGAGLTLACGSNACAAAVTGIHKKLLDERVTVELPLGSLQVEWKGRDAPVFLTGPAEKVYEGVIDCNARINLCNTFGLS